MRGFLKPAVRHRPNDPQTAFQKLPRGKRTKLAKLAETTLVKADQWARGGAVPKELGQALEKALHSLDAKKKKKPTA